MSIRTSDGRRESVTFLSNSNGSIEPDWCVFCSMSLVPRPSTLDTTADQLSARERPGWSATPPAGFRIDSSEWRVFTATKANTLMLGEPLAVTRILNAAWLTLSRPVFWCDGPRLTLPTGQAGTFVLWRLDALDAEDQGQLLEWLDGRGPARVLARAPRSVFPLVQQGQFLAALYYRLNTLILQTS